jgi:hypothetical protein
MERMEVSDISLVNVAPTPVLSRFERLNDGVPGAVEMLAGMTIR